jgi:hypothetical protein
MKINLTPIVPPYKNKYIIAVKFMHGDADAYTTETYVCKDRADFIRVMSSPDGPQEPASGGDEDAYNEFYADLFRSDDFIPYDCTGYDCKASIRNFTGFFYDEDGSKYTATLES